MKYMTKEWYQTMQNTSFHFPLHASKHAEKFSEAFYRALYEAREDEMVRTWEEVSKVQFEDIYCDSEEQYVAECMEGYNDLPEEEYEQIKAAWAAQRSAALASWSDRPRYDPEKTRENFRKAQRNNVKCLKEDLPEYMLQQVADVRVLALDFASAAVKRDITAWCTQNRKEANQTAKGYEKQYRAMLKKGNPAFLEDFSFHDCKITSCRRQGKNLVIRLDNSGGFTDVQNIILEQCTILKQERPFRNAWWLYEEIYPVDGGWEIHVLLQNSRMQLIDFIVQVAGVRLKR